MAIHTIRLRAPWKWEREGDRDVWHRVLGRPTNLSEGETVRLVLRSESSRGVAVLNGNELGDVPAVYEVTNALEVRNRLSLRIEEPGEIEEAGREPPFEVWLEIESD
jgi:hypothetical protein